VKSARRPPGLHLPRNLLKPFQIVLFELRAELLMLVLLLLERRDRLLEPCARVGVGRRVFAQDVGVAPEASPRATTSSIGWVDAMSCSSSVASVAIRPAAACASSLRRSPSSNARHASWKPPRQRRGVFGGHRRKAVPADLQLRNPIDGMLTRQTFDLPANRHAIRLFARERFGALLLRRALLLAFRDGFTDGRPTRIRTVAEARGRR